MPEAAEPDPLNLTRVTVVPAGALQDEAQANDWLERCRRKAETRDGESEAAVLSLNKVITAQRLAAGDPYVREVTHAHAQRVRLGYGTGEELVGGRWRAAYTLPTGPTKTRRRAMLAPQEELAAILGDRRPRFPSEELVLRARLDLDQRRPREAALQIAAALEALELERGAVGGESEGVRAERATAHELAGDAMRDELSDTKLEVLGELITACEREIRRRRYRGGALSAGGGEPQREGVEDRGETSTEPSAASQREQ